METGIRFTCLKNGDNLLGQTWEYKGKTDVEAIEEKVKDMFKHVDICKVNYVIDTLLVSKDALNNVYLPNTGVNGDLWPMNRRLQLYKQCNDIYKDVKLVVELEFPTVVTAFNYMQYAQFATEIIKKYSYIKYWQIMTVPESYDETGAQKCPPDVYVQLIKYIHTTIHENFSDINIGGPAVFTAVNEYVESEYLNSEKQTFHKGWLAEATGEFYGTDPKYDLTEKSGFLPYIDFFSFWGDNSTGEFKYETFPLVIKKMQLGLIEQGQRTGFNLNVPFWSTKQGHFADKENNQDLQLQAYRDLKEYMGDFIVNVVPFKSQLVDEFYNPLDGNAVKNVYGVLYYYLGNDRKPSYTEFNFVLNMLSEYHEVCRDEMLIKAKRPYEYTADVYSVMFINDNKDKILTAIYPTQERIISPSNKIFTTVSLKPALNRVVYIPNGTKAQIDSMTDVNFKNYDFILVEEKLVVDTKTNEDLQAEVKEKLNFYETYVKNWMEHVPDDYNKEIFDTNFYKLVRAVAMEFGEMRHEFKILKDNNYLSTAHGDAIWNNFGALIGVKWKPKWSEEEYRRAVSAIIESILAGANKNSIQKAIKGYTGFDVKIYEMFKDYEHYGLSQDLNWDNQYKFTIEVEKGLDDNQSLDEVTEEIKEVVDLTRPAHTLPVIMIVLVGEENYREWYKERYGRDFANSDEFNTEIYQLEESNKYGWKGYNYDWVLQSDSNHSVKINSAFPIGARYTLYDRMSRDILTTFDVKVPKPKENLLAHYYMQYEDVYNRPIKEELSHDVTYYFSERKFGIKPLVTDRILKTNGGLIYDDDGNVIGNEGRKVNHFVTGFKYALYDDFWMLFEYFGEEKFHKVKESGFWSDVLWTFKEKYETPKEEKHLHLEVGFEELKYGLVPLNQKVMITSYPDEPAAANKLRRITDRYRYAVHYRVKDEMPQIITELNEEIFKKPTESSIINKMTSTFTEEPYKIKNEEFGIKLYKVKDDGTEEIIRQEGVL